MNERVELEQGVERGAVGRGHELHGVGGQAGGGERLLKQGGEGGVCIENLLTAAQDARVARFEAENGAVDGDVGTRFVNDADDADGHAHLADAQAVGTGPVVERFANGIGERGHLADGFGEVRDAFGREREAVDHGLAQAGGLGAGEIFGVGRQQVGGGGGEEIGELEEGGVFLFRRSRGQHKRGRAGAAGEIGDEFGKISGIGGHGFRG